MNFLTALWKTFQSNPYFVAAYSAFGGALFSAFADEYTKGHIDLTRAGITHLAASSAGVAFWAVYHLYQNPPIKES